MYCFLLDPLPTLSAVIRGPTGRYVWTMQLRQFSRQKNVQHFLLFIQLILYGYISSRFTRLTSEISLV